MGEFKLIKLAIAVLLLLTIPAFGQSLDELKSQKPVIHDIQEALAERGFAVGTPDGALGRKTNAAFAKLVGDAGLADAPLTEQLMSLGIDLTALSHLTLTTDGPWLKIDNGLDSGIEHLSYQYDWKSFQIGRYSVDDEGVENFVLDEQYCDTYATQGSDCSTGRARVQVRDITEPSAKHVLYSFDFMVRNLPASLSTIQFAELSQQGGIKAKHPETGAAVNYSPRFTLEVSEGKLMIQDNSLIDVSLIGGSVMKEIALPLKLGEWTRFDLEVIWSTDMDGLFRYWVNGKPLWERKGRNTTCTPGKGECILTMKYGPYSSHYDGPSYKDDPVRFAFRNVRKVAGDDVSAHLPDIQSDFLVATAREGGPTQATRMTISEQHSSDLSDLTRVNSHLHVVIAGAPEGESEVDVNVQGSFLVAKESFLNLRMVITTPLGKTAPPGLRNCQGTTSEAWDDGQYRAILNFTKVDGEWVAKEAQCLIDNTPAEVGFMIRFVTTKFKDVATDMATSGSLGMIRHQPYRGWLMKVASGEVVLK